MPDPATLYVPAEEHTVIEVDFSITDQSGEDQPDPQTLVYDLQQSRPICAGLIDRNPLQPDAPVHPRKRFAILNGNAGVATVTLTADTDPGPGVDARPVTLVVVAYGTAVGVVGRKLGKLPA